MLVKKLDNKILIVHPDLTEGVLLLPTITKEIDEWEYSKFEFRKDNIRLAVLATHLISFKNGNQKFFIRSYHKDEATLTIDALSHSSKLLIMKNCEESKILWDWSNKIKEMMLYLHQKSEPKEDE